MATTGERPLIRRSRWGWVVAAVAGAWLAWAFWPERQGLPVRATLKKGQGGIVPKAFSPDGTALVTTDDTVVEVWDVARAKRRSGFTTIGRANRVAVSPDGRRLAVQVAQRSSTTSFLVVYEVEKGGEVARLDLRLDHLARFAFGPDGSTLRAYRWHQPAGTTGAGASWELAEYDVDHGAAVATKPLPLPEFSGAVFSPDGRRVVGLRNPDRLGRLYDVETGAAVSDLADEPAGKPSAVADAEFSNDGRRLAVAREDGTVEVWDVAGPKRLATLRGVSRGYRPRGLAFTPDGRSLVVQAFDPGVGPLGGWVSVARRLLTYASTRGRSNGRFEILVFDLDGGRLRARLRQQAAPDPVLSPDGSTLATVDVDKPNTAHLWDLKGRGNLEGGGR